jgi:hypothetical protein
MENYPLDIGAYQILRWLRDEQRLGPVPVDVRATRSYVFEEPTKELEDIAGEEADPLDATGAVGILEVTPSLGRDGWVLTIRVEDEIGDRLPEDESAPDEEEEIDLETFNSDFIVPERGTVLVSVDAEDEAAKARFDELLTALLKNIHQPGAV